MSSPDFPPQNPYSYDGAAAPVRSGEFPARMENWIPPKNATMHNGETIWPTLIFPYHPPSEIGQVYTVASDCHTFSAARWRNDSDHRNGVLASLFVGLFLFPFQALAFLEVFGIGQIPGLTERIIYYLIVFLFFLIDYALIRALCTRTISFVGEDGYYKLKKYRHKIKQRTVLFKNCTSMNFVKQHSDDSTILTFELLDRDQSIESFTIYFRKRPSRSIQLGASVDLAWMQYFLRSVETELEKGKPVDFPFGERALIRFTPQGLFLIVGARTIPVAKSNLRELNAGQWYLKVDVGPDPFSDIFHNRRVDFTQIPNFRALLIMIERTLQLKIENPPIELTPAWFPASWESFTN